MRRERSSSEPGDIMFVEESGKTIDLDEVAEVIYVFHGGDGTTIRRKLQVLDARRGKVVGPPTPTKPGYEEFIIHWKDSQ